MSHDLSFGLLLKQITDALRKNANNALRAHDLTVAQFCLLLELYHAASGQHTLKELEQRLHLAQSTVAGIVSRLEQKRLVEGHGDPEDRRVKWVRITDAGRSVIAAARAERDRSEEQLLSGLTETEREIFFTLLKKVHSSIP